MNDDIDTLQLIADGEVSKEHMDYLCRLSTSPYKLNIEPSTPENELGWVRTNLKGEEDSPNLERAIRDGWVPIQEGLINDSILFPRKLALTENSLKELSESPHISFKDGFIRTKDSILCIRKKKEQEARTYKLLFEQSHGISKNGYVIHPHSCHAELEYNEETDCVELITVPSIYDKEKGRFIPDLKNKETCVLYSAEALSREMPEVDEILKPFLELVEYENRRKIMIDGKNSPNEESGPKISLLGRLTIPMIKYINYLCKRF